MPVDNFGLMEDKSKCMEVAFKLESDRIPLVPPGYASLRSFTLNRMQDDAGITYVTCPSNSTANCQSEKDCRIVDKEKFTKSLQWRPWINYRQIDISKGELDSEFLVHDISSINPLTKGVIRGCLDCANCQRVLARWKPEDAHRPILDEAPVYYPNEEEFKDTIRYISSIRPQAEKFGICRIVPPSSWKPPCHLKRSHVWEKSNFPTRIQRLDKLQNPGRFGFELGPEFTMKTFQEYADYFKRQYFFCEEKPSDTSSNQDNLPKQGEPSIENIEGEYWRIVENPTEEIEVLYGADLETKFFGSGFPKVPSVYFDREDKCLASGWNLNNISRLPGSLLSFERTDISGILVPWLYIGMCFSSFCWHVEDHHFYSLSYMHLGAPKIWYGVPGKDALKHEAAMRKHLSRLFEEQPDLLHNLVTQFSPSTLKLEGVPVYRCVQHPGEFILTFPRAYHSGFNCGFNCSESVNLAPIDWLPHGQNAIELYSAQGRKPSISHDMLLLGAAREAVRAQWNFSFPNQSSLDCLLWRDASGQNTILTNTLKVRVELERTRREFLCSSQWRKMDDDFDSNTERECFICHYDLHFSAATCSCSFDTFSCLEHAMQLCSCDWGTKTFLFRYEISELNILVDAVGGKLSAVHKWGYSDLGLSLSFVNKGKHYRATESSSEGKQKKERNYGDSSSMSVLNDRSYQKWNEDGITDQTSLVREGCSSSSSHSLSNAGSHPFVEKRPETTVGKKTFKEQNSGVYSISAAEANPTVNSGESRKPNSVSNLDKVLLSGQEFKKCLQVSNGKEKEGNETRLHVFERDQPLTVDVITGVSISNKEDVDPDSIMEKLGCPVNPHLYLEGHEKDENVRYNLPRGCYLSRDSDDELTAKRSEDTVDTLMDSWKTVAKNPSDLANAVVPSSLHKGPLTKDTDLIDERNQHLSSNYCKVRLKTSDGDLSSTSVREFPDIQAVPIPDSQCVLHGLLKKANPEELQALHSTINASTSTQHLVRLLDGEIMSRVTCKRKRRNT